MNQKIIFSFLILAKAWTGHAVDQQQKLSAGSFVGSPEKQKRFQCKAIQNPIAFREKQKTEQTKQIQTLKRLRRENKELIKKELELRRQGNYHKPIISPEGPVEIMPDRIGKELFPYSQVDGPLWQAVGKAEDTNRDLRHRVQFLEDYLNSEAFQSSYSDEEVKQLIANAKMKKFLKQKK